MNFFIKSTGSKFLLEKPSGVQNTSAHKIFQNRPRLLILGLIESLRKGL
jgi:hypothetical protein